MIDFHNHLLPAVDDGAADLGQAREALEALWSQGVRAVVVTPHHNASLADNPARLAERLAELDAAWGLFASMARAEFTGLRVERGCEVMLDIPRPQLSDPRVRLAGTAFALVEFPYMTIPPGADRVLYDLRMQGWTPIVAHPERYANLDPSLAKVEDWLAVGALLQVNAGSLLGRYGSRARDSAWEILRRGWAHYLSSDFHARGVPGLSAARAAIEQAGGMVQAEMLTSSNAERLLNGEAPLPVPPLSGRRGLWSRLLGRRFG